MFSNIIGSSFEEMRPGVAVEVFFEDVTDEIAIPKFRLAGN